jgi:hypothetical protein
VEGKLREKIICKKNIIQGGA